MNISSLGDEPSIYDLPIVPAFGVFTAPIQDPTVIENDQGIIRLKRDVYNGVTANPRYQSSASILYTIDMQLSKMQPSVVQYFLSEVN